MTEKRTIKVALAGQPNVGKSTVFNLLTGLSQHVGNWPGKTVERKEGVYSHNEAQVTIVDLPGTYSLTANSAEEVIARDHIIREKPDVVVAVINASSMERNLYLVAELLPLPSPVIVALNMMDVARQQGLKIEPRVLEAALGVPVVPMTATKNEGICELVEAIDEVARDGADYRPKKPQIRGDHRAVLEEIDELVGQYVPQPYPPDWVSLKLLEGDDEILSMMKQCLPDEVWDRVHEILKEHEDAVVAVASGRYDWIARMTRAALVRPRIGQVTLTEKLDRWAAHPVWGLMVLAGILGLVFLLTYSVGAPLQGALETYVIETSARLLTTALASAPAWVRGLLVDGVIGGAGTVVTFIPILIIFFAIMGLLEDIGYMARAGYVMDRLMHLMGLHGKSFLPLFLGFGCNVPAVMGTRVIESRRGRLLTIMLVPLVPCTARMMVLAFITPLFFGAAAPVVAWSLVGLSLVVLAVSGVVINRVAFGGERSAFIMELPLYHVPNWRTIGILIWQRSLAFFKRAGTVILVVSVVLWALSALPTGDIQTSFLARAGQLLVPMGALLGLNWEMMVALLTSFIAKENSIASLGVLYGGGDEAGLAEILPGIMTPAAALSFLVVQMLFIPCVATVTTVLHETNSWKWTLFNLGLLLAVSFGVAIVVYQVATLWG
ncbi:MAG: ferrous iron transport protein B [Anaerolineae bacterium]|nr:ferrous iron transport protein B [Anaerolineae bacterium]NIN98632.1 ferrous iron transport protein B [Anaerolineae bacterium]NIQ81519.1 ferrous iron transport protein B [Anaerolineae bacterium]